MAGVVYPRQTVGQLAFDVPSMKRERDDLAKADPDAPMIEIGTIRGPNRLNQKQSSLIESAALMGVSGDRHAPTMVRDDKGESAPLYDRIMLLTAVVEQWLPMAYSNMVDDGGDTLDLLEWKDSLETDPNDVTALGVFLAREFGYLSKSGESAEGNGSAPKKGATKSKPTRAAKALTPPETGS